MTGDAAGVERDESLTPSAEEDPRGTQYRIILYFAFALPAYLLFFVRGAQLAIVVTSLLVMPLACLLPRRLGESAEAAWEMIVVAMLAAVAYGAALILDPRLGITDAWPHYWRCCSPRASGRSGDTRDARRRGGASAS